MGLRSSAVTRKKYGASSNLWRSSVGMRSQISGCFRSKSQMLAFRYPAAFSQFYMDDAVMGIGELKISAFKHESERSACGQVSDRTV